MPRLLWVAIMFHGVAIARVVIATRFPNGCNSMFLLPRFSGVVIIFVALQLLSTYCNYNPKWSQYHVNIATVFLCCYRLPLMQRPKSVAIYKMLHAFLNNVFYLQKKCSIEDLILETKVQANTHLPLAYWGVFDIKPPLYYLFTWWRWLIHFICQQGR